MARGSAREAWLVRCGWGTEVCVCVCCLPAWALPDQHLPLGTSLWSELAVYVESPHGLNWLPTESGCKAGRACWWVLGIWEKEVKVDPCKVWSVAAARREWHFCPAPLAVSEESLVWQPLLQADCSSKSMISVLMSDQSPATEFLPNRNSELLEIVKNGEHSWLKLNPDREAHSLICCPLFKPSWVCHLDKVHRCWKYFCFYCQSFSQWFANAFHVLCLGVETELSNFFECLWEIEL